MICDSKAEFYEMYSELLREQGYFVRSYNLLDLEASDGWNCLMDSSRDINLVQHIAEIIIRNTSADSEREDFWSKAEKNLLMALIHFVQSMTYPGTNTLLPPEERSLGTIYRLLASTSVNELDARFRALPPGHPGGSGPSVPGVQPEASAIPADALGAAALRCQPAAGDPAGPPQRAEPPHQQIRRLV